MADDKRIIQYPEVESVNVSDYMMMDSASNGTTKYQVSRILSQAAAEAQNKVDAEAAARAAADTAIDERVTANETDITGLKNDLSSYKVLWSGTYLMLATHTITLSERISAQKNGIVLVWSAFVDDAAQDYDLAYHFVPKLQATNFNGKGVGFSLETANTAGYKYLYIFDDKITGYTVNGSSSQTGSNSGIVHKNNYWVLRYVLGV